MLDKEQVINALYDFVDEYGSPFATTCPEEMSIIEDAEVELITNGVPFRPTYAFLKNTEHYLGVNIDLRDKYHLNDYEKEWENA